MFLLRLAFFVGNVSSEYRHAFIQSGERFKHLMNEVAFIYQQVCLWSLRNFSVYRWYIRTN
jgi:hypothetical protein